jgi:two-component system, NarL family, nitrate/nitrite response regulator NarL
MVIARQMIRVALIDDHPMLRRGLRETLTEQGDFTVVAEGGSADDAIELALSKKSDIMIVDVNMPGNGLNAVKSISGHPQPPRLVVLSVFDNMANVRTAMENGASGYVLKGIEGDELARILRAVHAGKKHVEPELAAKLFAQTDETYSEEPDAETAKHNRLRLLSKREKQIFDLMSKGMSNRDIAKKLRLGEETVKHYNTQMFQKLGVKNRTEAALLKN